MASERSEDGGDEQRSQHDEEQQQRSQNGSEQQRSQDGESKGDGPRSEGGEQQRSDDGEGKDEGRDSEDREGKDSGRDSEDREGEKRRSSSEESSGREGSFAAGFGQALPMALVGVIIVLYFVWICYELGSHAHDGLGIVFGVFGAILVGILSAAVAMGMRKIASRSNSSG
jgi:cobalamin biosynthesis Mg chelatase CobN